jgi:nucleoid-associated protein YgaU
MPVSLTSRYGKVPVHRATDADGTSRPTIGIRPTAPPPPTTAVYRHVLTGAETLEYLAWRYYGRSDAWWRIAEANRLVFPLDFPTGRAVEVASPNDVGRIERTRSF